MKYLFILLSLVFSTAFAEEKSTATLVDFSKAYVIPQSADPTQLKIGGVETQTGKDVLLHALALGFDAKDASFRILEAISQTTDAELLAQLLRDTTWVGDYKTNKNYYYTELSFKSIQKGFVGGEIFHTTRDPEKPVFLRATVVGTIVTQYLLEQEEGKEIWVDAQQIDYAKLPPSTVIPPDDKTKIRQLIRFRRIEASEFSNPEGGWGTFNEYRLALINNELTGIVGTPADRFGVDDSMTGVGEIKLVLKEETPVETPKPE